MNRSEKDDEVVLTPIDDERLARIEDGVFTRIGADRREDARRRARRGRVWMAGGAAAAVIAVAAVIAPSVGDVVTGGSDAAVAPATGDVFDSGAVTLDAMPETGAESGTAADLRGGAAAVDGTQVISSASATVKVDDPGAALEAVGAAATARGGYVESSRIGAWEPVQPIDVMPAESAPAVFPEASGGWVSVRVPAEELPALLEDLAEIGEVVTSSLDRTDVTTQVVDLQARVDAARTSVERLTELLAQAADVSDLIAAESALAERQATLESYQQQLDMLDEQVAMASLWVTVEPRTTSVSADPAGFTDGVAAGWNGLVATLNAIVIALGFLVPWLLVVGVAGVVVWIVVRTIRRRRRGRRATPPESKTE
ncbi:DUF4349 domain-containing protein [Microbacterium chocolatum]|uniref:DUF4349 domain-containing protein n=1 Tax=Microbacterium aurantiacum TaxID=162393 RepID=UPI00338E8330